MKAAVIREFGGPENFEIADMPLPIPGPGQVRVRVRATSVNPVDFKIRRNGTWARVPMPAILGYDAAGIIDATGDGVSHLKVGDEVFYSAKIFGRQGTYAEYHVEDADIVAKKPSHLSFEEAAVLPLAGMTAYDSIVTFFQTRLGDSVLIHAGSGGVGSLAIQLAKASGAFVITTARQDNAELLKSLGADVVIDYREQKFEDAVMEVTEGRGVDACYDTIGGDTIPRSISCVRPFGKLATITGIDGSIGGMQMKNLSLYYGFLERTSEKIQAFSLIVARRQIRPVIDSVFNLDDIASAHRKIEAGGMKGKIAITI